MKNEIELLLLFSNLYNCILIFSRNNQSLKIVANTAHLFTINNKKYKNVQCKYKDIFRLQTLYIL